ncbi:DoxX family protein [Nocardia sienata]|uniref:DoxX family protein n=1 Tax=Nocardia sienata TaxID=248552 RepID=UPI0007A3AB31|nr:DoxX family membrane protein [Nocardia sienata]
MLLRRFARPLLASAFVVNGVETLMHPESRVKEASTLVHKGKESLPSDIAGNLPADPGTLVRVTAAVQIAGGALLALGKAPRPAALALAATVVPATVTEQNFWAENDPERRAAKRTAFLKDVSLLGGLMIAASDTAGKPSLGWRGRRAARRAAATVGGALPVGASARGNGTGEAVRQQLHQAADRGRDLAGSAAGRGAELAEIAQQRGPVWAETAKKRGADWADIAKHRGAELAETAQTRGPEWAAVAKTRAAELADYTKHRGSELAETAQHRGPEWAEAAKNRAAELADYTKHRSGELAETAQHRGPEWAEAAKNRAAELADYTKHRSSELGASAKAQRAQLAKAKAKADKAKAKAKKKAAKSKLR